jgi:hypothetical protein
MAASDAFSEHGGPDASRAAGPTAFGGLRSAADCAWEFLRRNPDYRAEFERCTRSGGANSSVIDARWGLRFPVDPRVPAGPAEVFWRPEIAPSLVLPLEVDPRGAAAQARRLPGAGPPKRDQDGMHLRLPSGLQLWLRGDATPEGPLVVVLAFDGDFGLRVRAVQALQRAADGAVGARSRLKAAQRQRLDRSLQALDGALGQQSYRSIAGALFGAARVEREPWKTASVRAVTIRLVRSGRALMRGGYLDLLKGGLLRRLPG